MGVFTLDPSNIKGIVRKIARARPVWIGPNSQTLSALLRVSCLAGDKQLWHLKEITGVEWCWPLLTKHSTISPLADPDLFNFHG